MGGQGGYGVPGMLKLHGSVVLAGKASVVAGSVAGTAPNQNGAITIISNMNPLWRVGNQPNVITQTLVQGDTTHDDYLMVAQNQMVGMPTPVLPQLEGHPDACGWCKPGYWNDGMEVPPFSTDNGLEYRVLRLAENNSVFSEFDQVVVRNTNTSGSLENVMFSMGQGPAMPIGGQAGNPGVLLAGQTWTTAVPAGAQVNVFIDDTPVEGEGETPLPHPADINTDFRIVIGEAIAYLTGWQQGGNPIAYAIRAAYIWQNGEQYGYDGNFSPPLCWILMP
ncbi:MAG: hypothetical protein BWY09_03005 [Candidatus Hydrogenedentes bacterium ADurb.Bin179]|nr:MAG: hypothetical protein BWY09_03005 [Candidatus Hydrogenedentes bacterium ADurb.Bin179]